MTWYFDPTERWMDVYDHNGDLVAEGVDFGGRWEGDFPKEVHAVMREAMGDGTPSRYNQLLTADAATNNIKQGIPPSHSAEARPPEEPDPAPIRSSDQQNDTEPSE